MTWRSRWGGFPFPRPLHSLSCVSVFPFLCLTDCVRLRGGLTRLFLEPALQAGSWRWFQLNANSWGMAETDCSPPSSSPTQLVNQSDNDRTRYGVRGFRWNMVSDLILSDSRTEEVTVDYRRTQEDGTRSSLHTQECLDYKGSTSCLTWLLSRHQRLFFSGSWKPTVSAWLRYVSWTAQNIKDSAQMVRTAQGIVGSPSPNLSLSEAQK